MKEPYVMFFGNRLLIMFPEVMQELGLEVGQSIGWDIFGAIQEQNIARLSVLIALEKASKSEG